MWPKLLARRLGVEYPILLGPMAGGAGTPELAAAVSEAGALGSLPAADLSPDELRAAIHDVRRRTARPFAVNLLATERRAAAPDLAGQLAAVLDERVPVVSFGSGAPAPADVATLRARGAVVLATAHCVEEARTLEASGVDVVVAEGAEAGGAISSSPVERALIGTVALVPQVVDVVRVPVVAAGGIMDGRAIVAAFALGAAGVQMGTAFLASAESGALPSEKIALLARRTAAAGPVTSAGRHERAYGSRFLVDVERACAILPYPDRHAASADDPRACTREGRATAPSMWAGQGAPLAVAKGARELVRDVVEQAERVVKGLR